MRNANPPSGTFDHAMKRIFLFLATNVAVLLVLSIVLGVLGLDQALAAQGPQYGPLLAFSAVVGSSQPTATASQHDRKRAHACATR